MEKYFPFNLNFFCSTNQGIETAVPVLLVDGYNVCGYWMKLRKHFMNGRLDIARQKLVDELITYSMLRGLYPGSSISFMRRLPYEVYYDIFWTLMYVTSSKRGTFHILLNLPTQKKKKKEKKKKYLLFW